MKRTYNRELTSGPKWKHNQEYKGYKNLSQCFIRVDGISSIIPRLCSEADRLCPITSSSR